jgi:hypothetical protein
MPESTLRGWKKKFDNNIEVKPGRKRRSGGGAKTILSDDQERELANWVLESREKGIAVTFKEHKINNLLKSEIIR